MILISNEEEWIYFDDRIHFFRSKNRIENEASKSKSGEISEEHFIHRTNIAEFCAQKSAQICLKMRNLLVQNDAKSAEKCVD